VTTEYNEQSLAKPNQQLRLRSYGGLMSFRTLTQD